MTDAEALKKDAITVLTAIELAQRLDGMGQARFAARWSAGKLALERIVRLAARVGEDWCFDMEQAPKTTDQLAPISFVAIRNKRLIICWWHDDRYAKKPAPFWAGTDANGNVAMARKTAPTCWMLPPPPESNDGA